MRGNNDDVEIDEHRRSGRMPLAALGGIALAAQVATAQVMAAKTIPVVPPAIAAPDMRGVMTVHAVGAQVYECVTDPAGKTDWRFREPIASLMIDGKTVGRHFAGPGWELADGSVVAGKVAASAAAAGDGDIPWLKLDCTAGRGQFADVTAIQRINTKGGVMLGACGNAGALQAVPYSADYVFLAKGR